MTAEALVMNKAAVAMAADSAVTISSGRAGLKTYDTVNKLFELIKGRPVAIMIYSNAEFNRVPWETIIKSYRDEAAGRTFDDLEQYVDDFSNYLQENASILPIEYEEAVIVDAAYAHFMLIFLDIQEGLPTCLRSNGTVIKARLRDLLKQILDKHEERLSRAERAPWFSEFSNPELWKKCREIVTPLAIDLFAKLPLTPAIHKRLVDNCLEALRRCVSEPAESGVVIAGFGKHNPFPKMVSFVARGRFAGVLRIAHREVTSVTADQPGVLEPFAQDEEAWAYLSGINSQVRDSVISYWHDWVVDCGPVMEKVVANDFPHISAEDRKKIADAAAGETAQRFDDFLGAMNARQSRFHVGPMLESIAYLPKDELGMVAESLVNLTLLKRKVSIYDAPTVGGAIDVALISRGDGLVWLKRKHYFSHELNPAWHLTHTGKM